jgi:hypothetical protein
MRCSTWAVLSLNLLVVTASCQTKKESAEQVSTPESSAKSVGKVEQAVANAVATGAPAAAAGDGPPPDGILNPARAESEAPSGSAPKLTLGGDGAEPRVPLRSSTATLPRSVKLEVTLQAGMGQGLPPIEMTLAMDSKRVAAAKPDPSNDGSGTLGASKGSAKAFDVTATIRDVKVMMPNVPSDFVSQLAGLKGGRVTFALTAEGGGYDFAAELPKASKPELRDLLDTVTEGLTLLTMPVPTQPVGDGAFWMVVARDKSAGFGLVSYHMVKLTSADAKAPEYEFDTRRYAIGNAIDPTLLPPGSEQATLKEMSAGVRGRVQLAIDTRLPVSLEADAALQGAVEQDAQSPKRAVQSMTRYRISVVR